MSRGYTAGGKRLSAMTHATRGHDCELCGRTVFGNGGQVSHGRAHTRRGEAVEMVKYYGPPVGTSRLFVDPNNEKDMAFLRARGFEVEDGKS